MKTLITYEHFVALDMRVALVIAAEFVVGADKLLKITLDVGELGNRVVVSGIREWYEPEQLVGKSVIYLANLEPRTIRGVESHGMVLAAGQDTAVLLEPEKPIAAGEAVR